MTSELSSGNSDGVTVRNEFLDVLGRIDRLDGTKDGKSVQIDLSPLRAVVEGGSDKGQELEGARAFCKTLKDFADFGERSSVFRWAAALRTGKEFEGALLEAKEVYAYCLVSGLMRYYLEKGDFSSGAEPVLGALKVVFSDEEAFASISKQIRGFIETELAIAESESVRWMNASSSVPDIRNAEAALALLNSLNVSASDSSLE